MAFDLGCAFAGPLFALPGMRAASRQESRRLFVAMARLFLVSQLLLFSRSAAFGGTRNPGATDRWRR